MKKATIYLLLIILILTSGCYNNYNNNNNIVKNELVNFNNDTALEKTYFQILNDTKDGKDYFKKNPETKIINQKIIHPENFEELKNKTRYKKLYSNLPKKKLHLVEFQQYNNSLKIATIIDIQNKEIVNMYGIYIIDMR